jgi:uncharacterized protein
LLLERHPDHARVSKAFRSALRDGMRAVTTNLVLSETYTFLVYRGHRIAALELLRSVRTSPNIVVTSTEELEEQARMDWLARYDDQDFSFADAVSFAVMRQRGMSRALTLDRHFVIAGFEMLELPRR